VADHADAGSGGDLVSPLARLRRIVQPGPGHRRAGRPRPVKPTPTNLMRPEEAMVNDLAYCPAEERETLHAFLRLGGRQCWTCRTVTTDPTPPGGVE